MHKVFILTGQINSGKTTALQHWISGRPHVYGILSPKTSAGRYFQNIETGETFLMDARAQEADVVKVGKHAFSKRAFSLATSILNDAIQKKAGWIVVDEIGPLELRGEGFSEVVKKLVSDENSNLEIILVVRSSLVDDVIHYFNLKHYQVITAPIQL